MTRSLSASQGQLDPCVQNFSGLIEVPAGTSYRVLDASTRTIGNNDTVTIHPARALTPKHGPFCESEFAMCCPYSMKALAPLIYMRSQEPSHPKTIIQAMLAILSLSVSNSSVQRRM
eukprot:6469711-Amphidinium_carterae.3